jgi:ComF family protein
MPVVVRGVRCAWQHARDFVFPPLCMVCSLPRIPGQQWLCRACLDVLAANSHERPSCNRCGLNPALRDCNCQHTWPFSFLRIVAFFDFGGPAQTVIHQIKYSGKKSLAYELGRDFAPQVLGGIKETIDCVVPVPLHTLRRLKRGYNQADYFARGLMAGCAMQAEYLPQALRRSRFTRTQTRLSRESRQRNLRNAFAVSPQSMARVAGRRCLVVDDVVTTGATVDACSRALLSAGALSVVVCALARD